MNQKPIGDADLDHLQIHRQQLCTSWKEVVNPPATAGANFRLVLPFSETFENAFGAMYTREFFANHAAGGRLQLWLNDTGGEVEVPEEAQEWIDTVGKRVAIQDYLAISFAIDFTFVGGDPTKTKSSIALLRRRAKPYGEDVTLTHHAAAAELAAECIEVLKELTCYDGADCVVAVPPSNPDKEYSLPRLLAAAIADEMDMEDLTKSIVTVKKRESVKEVALDAKLKLLRGSIEVEPDIFNGRTVLLIDDLYQSGTTINYCAQLLLESGADAVLGLACEKTCRNDDNQPGS
jgi:hypothetical protein